MTLSLHHTVSAGCPKCETDLLNVFRHSELKCPRAFFGHVYFRRNFPLVFKSNLKNLPSHNICLAFACRHQNFWIVEPTMGLLLMRGILTTITFVFKWPTVYACSKFFLFMIKTNDIQACSMVTFHLHNRRCQSLSTSLSSPSIIINHHHHHHHHQYHHHCHARYPTDDWHLNMFLLVCFFHRSVPGRRVSPFC